MDLAEHAGDPFGAQRTRCNSVGGIKAIGTGPEAVALAAQPFSCSIGAEPWIFIISEARRLHAATEARWEPSRVLEFLAQTSFKASSHYLHRRVALRASTAALS